MKLPQLKLAAKREGWADWIRSEADERAVLDGCWFDKTAANHWVTFFETYLRHTMGNWAGQPFKLLDWQKNKIVMPLFGWKKDKLRPHVRRYSKGDIFVAKKQGKSTIAAGIVCAFLLKGGQRAEVYGVAHTRDQSGIIYREAAAMARSSPQLASRLKPLDTHKRIVYGKTGSFYQAMAGENSARGAEGINPVAIIFDEIHVQRDRVLYDSLVYASAARENSLMLSVSTVGIADITTIWWEQYEYAKGIVSGAIHDNSRFAFVAQADDGCKFSAEMRADPAQWAKAMPSLNVTVSEEKVREAVLEAENSPKKMNSLLRYMFNIPTAQIDKVIDIEKWNAMAGEIPDLTGRTCFAGVDIASREDLATRVLFFPPIGDEDKGYVLTKFWCPAAKIREREQKGQAHYRQWVNDEHIVETPGERIDHEYIEKQLREDAEQYCIQEILFDEWNADAVLNPLQNDGMECVVIKQTYTGMSEFCHTFLDAITEDEFIHDGNPVMAWCCANTAATQKGDAIRFDKSASADKIDGAVAGAMAVGRGLTTEAGTSVYDQDGASLGL